MAIRISREQAAAMGIPFIEDPPASKGKKNPPQAHTNKLFDSICESHGLPAPVHEYQFHPQRKWAFDYLFEGWLAVEKEGGVFGRGKPCPACKRRPGGAHSSIAGMKRDIEKYNAAAQLGYVVLRFRPEQFDSGEAFGLIRKVLEGEE
ncbi:MAG: hypothetical protein U0744_02530 [Gemmataceae bacterium]